MICGETRPDSAAFGTPASTDVMSCKGNLKRPSRATVSCVDWHLVFDDLIVHSKVNKPER